MEKKSILFIFSRHSENPKDSTLTKDISDEFFRHGHQVKVVTMLEKKHKRKTQLNIENGYPVLRVKTGNYFDSPGKIEKGITALTMPRKLEKAIKKYFKKEKFDLIYTHTPFVSNARLMNNLKGYYKCKACLHLWDIFPQNAKDINLLNNRILLKFFEIQEQKMYDSFDYIGCMSKGNLEYMKIRDKNIKLDKYFILKNWAKIKEKSLFDKILIREKYGYNINDFICIFGGNMGKPQKLENLLELAKKALIDKNIKFLFVGKGTEKNLLENKIKNEKINNVKILDYIPREDYELVTASCDVGLVSLDERFTVPNFPSKTTDYFKLELPILASLDSCAATDYGNFLQNEVKGGLFALAGDVDKLYSQLLKLKNNSELKIELGKNGRQYYENELGVNKAYETIMKQIKNRG
ncbi:MAG: glycosyltransferase family 4 protein [Cetobacterium sp.]|uniref:glycosyltransferase family 4 protein n=1 Tax=Cetobacterium sp. TaxID=2071632 RepID=UPI003F3C569E